MNENKKTYRGAQTTMRSSFGPALLLCVICSCFGPWNGLRVEVGEFDGLGMVVVEREGGWEGGGSVHHQWWW